MTIMGIIRKNIMEYADIIGEDLAEHIQAFIDIEESIAQVMKNGVDL